MELTTPRRARRLYPEPHLLSSPHTEDDRRESGVRQERYAPLPTRVAHSPRSGDVRDVAQESTYDSRGWAGMGIIISPQHLLVRVLIAASVVRLARELTG